MKNCWKKAWKNKMKKKMSWIKKGSCILSNPQWADICVTWWVANFNLSRKIGVNLPNMFKVFTLYFQCCQFYFTDLGSLIGNTQCGIFRILLPLRFYVESILVILTIWSALNFKFLGTFGIFKCIFSKIQIQSL